MAGQEKIEMPKQDEKAISLDNVERNAIASALTLMVATQERQMKKEIGTKMAGARREHILSLQMLIEKVAPKPF